MNNRRRKTSLTNICTSHFIARVRKGYSRFACERELETEQKLQYSDPHSYGRQRCVFLLWTPIQSGLLRAPSAGCDFPYHISSRLPLELELNCHWLLSWLSYIIVQRPLDLWNRMFNRHQAEITVMQFTGHSLPVHQSMSVPWEFFSSSHLISQFPPTRFPLITAIRMCHFLPVHHLGMAFLAGYEGQNISGWHQNKGLNTS